MTETPVARTTIALVGSGEYLERCREVDEHLLGLLEVGARAPRVACLPTAASSEGDAVWQRWSRMGVEWFTSLGAETVAVDVIDRTTANAAEMVEAVAGADLVYLSGGKPPLLYEILRGSAVWEAILGALDRGGILAGCSAGAMVQGSHIAALRGGRGTVGFGLLPGTIIIPHFDEFPSMVTGLVRRVVGGGHTVIGVDGATALVRHHGGFRAVGSGRVEVWGPAGHHRFHREAVPPEAVAPMDDHHPAQPANHDATDQEP